MARATDCNLRVLGSSPRWVVICSKLLFSGGHWNGSKLITLVVNGRFGLHANTTNVIVVYELFPLKLYSNVNISLYNKDARLRADSVTSNSGKLEY